ncbi:DNA polymerase-1 [Amycolatopsis cihanbeyliensis]|uniref:DNA polymerase I n=1 Tax=Amycolatopsis cihanbeyliensis TaxID=1128664 RepID=A0A542DNJ0_AMYCI|nr:DNA polymerase-1 [Amycolatopsis cihanbeyliensis]
MKEFRHAVSGEQVVIRVVERPDDLDGFRTFIRSNLRCLAVDSETTGLDIYSPGFAVRLVQFGNSREAWVVPVELGGPFADDVRRALLGLRTLVVHNAGFDLQVFARTLGIPMEELWPKVTDSQTLAHLVDPRDPKKGGVGLKLEELTAHYIDAELATNVKGLMLRLARKYKTTKAKIWTKVDLFDPDYLLYAGMDTILASRITQLLWPKLPPAAPKLIPFEREVSEICSEYERTGFLLDVEYTQSLSDRLREEEDKYTAVAQSFGCESVNSGEQVAHVLQRRGVELTKRTASGKLSVDKSILEPLAAAGDEFAIAVQEAKRARKWRTTWVDTFLATRDEHDRCHPSINPLQARSGRMSITGIPAQTLPAGDWMIRRCFVADDGHRIGSVDYQTQELRVLAALSQDRRMIQAFDRGLSLHLLTARAAFGEHVEKDTKEYKAGKGTNFAVCYGGTWRAVNEQFGVAPEDAKKAVNTFWSMYQGVKRFKQRLERQAKAQGYITTPIGRRLPVDRDRPYSALNYMVQSYSRDVTCRGIIRLHKAGYTPYIRLPIHDEVVASLPAEHAQWGARQIARHMAEDMGPVRIGTDSEVGLRSWGSLYGADH